MTTPQPDTNHVANALQLFKELPKWAIAAIVVGGGLLAWYLIEAAGSDTDTKGISGVSGQGAGDDSSSHWAPSGGQSSQGYQNFATSTPQTGQATPPDSGASYSDAADATAYWYVPVAPAGWSSTFGGIAQQFYGSTGRANEIAQLNPNLSTTTYGKLPVGAMIKVPRS